MLTLFIIISIVELILLLVSGYLLYKATQMAFSTLEKVESVRDQVEESLDTLDGSYRKIAEVAGFDVISDEPFVKQVVQAVVEARDAIHLIAVKISSEFEEESDDKEKDVNQGENREKGAD